MSHDSKIPLHKPPQTPYQQTIRTSFARPELQQEEGESDGSEESYIWLDLEGEFGFSSSSSDSANDHVELCPSVMEKTREFLSGFNPSLLQFNAPLLYAYQAASSGSRSFNIHLIEIIAIAVHEIAVMVFKLDTNLHKDDGITSWIAPKENEEWWRLYPDGPPPTLFYHNWYMDYQQYPNGIADMVGYWAEARILGGVILFDRHTPESDTVFLFPEREDVTYRICKLLDSQKRQLLDFFSSESPQHNPLPILSNGNNLQRVDPEEPISRTGIYRDKWERNPRPLYFGDGRSRTVYDPLNFPTRQDQNEAQVRWKQRDY
ncbi:hypothetical protein B7463_g12630, partial [Scytalidium lignicola]